MNDIVQIIQKSEKDWKTLGMRKILINNKFLFCEFRDCVEIHDIKNSTAVVITKPHMLLYKHTNPEEVKHLHIEDKITVSIDVPDIKISSLAIPFVSVSFFESSSFCITLKR